MSPVSWDVDVQDWPPVATPWDIPDGFDFQPIGTRIEITTKIREVAPAADFTDPAWGRIESDDYSIEVNIGDDEPLYWIRVSRPRR
jgi:hypothetical protein